MPHQAVLLHLAHPEAPLSDWIDIGVFDAKMQPLYLAKHKIDKPEMKFTLTVAGVPETGRSGANRRRPPHPA